MAFESVHLEKWPTIDREYVDKELEESMNSVFEIFADVAEARQKAGIKLR